MTRARRSSRCNGTPRAAITLAALGGLACLVCFACGAPAASSLPVNDGTEAHEAPPRQPDGVWLEPEEALPAARDSVRAGTESSTPVVALRTPVDRPQVVALVHRFVDSLARNDEHAVEALCARARPGGVAPTVRMRVLIRTHDFTKLAGQRVFRDENVRVRRGNEDADGGVHDAGADARDTLSVRVAIDVNQAGGEVLFGNVLGLELVEQGGVLLIQDLDLNADP